MRKRGVSTRYKALASKISSNNTYSYLSTLQAVRSHFNQRGSIIMYQNIQRLDNGRVHVTVKASFDTKKETISVLLFVSNTENNTFYQKQVCTCMQGFEPYPLQASKVLFQQYDALFNDIDNKDGRLADYLAVKFSNIICEASQQLFEDYKQ